MNVFEIMIYDIQHNHMTSFRLLRTFEKGISSGVSNVQPSDKFTIPLKSVQITSCMLLLINHLTRCCFIMSIDNSVT